MEEKILKKMMFKYDFRWEQWLGIHRATPFLERTALHAELTISQQFIYNKYAQENTFSPVLADQQ